MPIHRRNVLASIVSVLGFPGAVAAAKEPISATAREGLESVDVRRLGIVDDGKFDAAPILNRFIENTAEAKLIFPRTSDQYYRFEQPILVPANRNFIFDGLGEARVRLVSTDEKISLFTYYLPPKGGAAWDRTNAITGFEELRARNNRPNGVRCIQQIVGVDNSRGTDNVYFDWLLVERSRLNAGGYCINLDEIQYSIAPQFRRLRLNGGGGIRVTPGKGAGSRNRHACSLMSIENVRADCNLKVGPHLHLEGCQGLRGTSIIIEGRGGWHPDLDPTGLAHYLHILNPGPHATHFEAIWFETSGPLTPGTWNIVIDSTEAAGPFMSNGVDFLSGNFPLHRLKLGGSGGAVNVVAKRVYAAKNNIDVETCSIDPMSALTLDRPNVLSMSLVQELINGGIRVVDPHVEDYAADHHYWPQNPTPGMELYAYTGGLPYNTQANTYFDPGEGVRSALFMHNDPQIGSCLLITNGSLQPPISGDEIGPLLKVGQQICWEYLLQIPHPQTASTWRDGDGWVQMLGLASAGAFGVGHSLSNGWKHARHCRPVSTADYKSYAAVPLFSPQVLGRPKWILIGGLVCALGECVSARFSKTANCFENPKYPGIPDGTHVPGDVVRSFSPYIDHYKCTLAGTTRPVSVTGNTTKGSAIVTGISDITDVIVGDYLEFSAGMEGRRRILAIDFFHGTLTVDRAATSDTTRAAISNGPSGWQTVLTSTPRTGSRSPVGAVPPDAIGQKYIDVSGPTLFVAIGTTSSDWLAVHSGGR